MLRVPGILLAEVGLCIERHRIVDDFGFLVGTAGGRVVAAVPEGLRNVGIWRRAARIG